jgi:coenzyme F420-dependent glucose-6-phosphate dehydrogenase
VTRRLTGQLRTAPVHIRRLKMMRGMGATAVVVMNVSAADPLGTLRLYGEQVFPELRR